MILKCQWLLTSVETVYAVVSVPTVDISKGWERMSARADDLDNYVTEKCCPG